MIKNEKINKLFKLSLLFKKIVTQIYLLIKKRYISITNKLSFRLVIALFRVKWFFNGFINGRGNNLIKLSRRNCPKKKRRIEEKSAIFYRDNARAMCCKIDTPEIGKGEMGSFLPPLLFRYCSLKLLYPSSNSPEITK